MKRIIRPLVIILVVLCIAFSIVWIIKFKKSNVTTSQTVSDMTFLVGGREINLVQGFYGDVDIYNLDIPTLPLGEKIKYKFEDGKKRKIKGTIFDTNKNKISEEEFDEDIEIKAKLKTNTEYILKIQVEESISEKINYVVRIYNGKNYFLEHFDFAQGLSDTLVDKKDMSFYSDYFPNFNNKDLSQDNIDLKSNAKQLQYDNSQVEVLQKRVPKVIAINDFMTSFEIEILYRRDKNEVRVAKEYFRIRDEKDSLRLLDYDRTEREIYDGKVKANKIFIAASDEKYNVVSNGNLIAFNQSGKGYFFDNNENVMTIFYNGEGNYKNIFDIDRGYTLKILSIDEAKNVDYVVIGRIPLGINKYHFGYEHRRYEHSSNKDYAIDFLETNQGMDVMMAHGYDYFHANEKNIYTTIGKSLLITSDKTIPKVIDYSSKDNLLFSKFTSDIAFTSGGDISVYKPDYDSTRNIKVDNNGYRIKPNGFMSNGDLVYSLIRNSDNITNKVFIVNSLNEVIKEYETDEIITDVVVVKNAVEIKRISKENKEKLDDDYIITTLKSDEFENSIYNRGKTTTVDLKFKKTVDTQSQKIKKAEFIGDLGRKHKIETEFNEYLTSSKGDTDMFSNDLVESIYLAKRNKGYVRKGARLIWQFQLARDNLYIDSMPLSQANVKDETAQACISSVIQYLGLNGKYENSMNLDENITALFKNNYKFYNLGINEILYFAQTGSPIMIEYNDGYILVLGMKQGYIVVLNPLNKKIEYISLKEFNDDNLVGYIFYRDNNA